jgi:hypothetical protein
MKKLLSKDLSEYRELQWEKQNKMCPICDSLIDREDMVLDHDHEDGNCRRVLHRSCNTAEGKIKKSYTRYVSGKGISFLKFLKNMVKYLETDYKENPIHPTELTENEKKLKSINKKLKSLKRESTIAEYKEQAKNLRVEIKKEREESSWKTS